MGRTTENANIHVRLIASMVKKLMTDGYKVSADHIGFPNGLPEKYRDYTPDIYAEKKDERIYIEAETCDSLDTTETKLQWIALSSNPDILFSVIIPKKCLDNAKKLVKKWDVNVKTFWTMDI